MLPSFECRVGKGEEDLKHIQTYEEPNILRGGRQLCV